MSLHSASPSRVPSGHSLLAQRWGSILNVTGAVVAVTGLAILVPATVSLIYGESRDAELISLAAGLTVAVGVIVWRLFRHRDLSVAEAFGAVGLAWVAMSAFGALPFLVTGDIPGVADAFFESASGFTATGSSVLSDPAALGHGPLFWRAMTQWLGGMGVIVLVVALLPLIGVGATHLARAESPGPEPERVTPRFQETAKRLWLVYFGLTLLQTVLLTVGDMTLFEGITHSFASLSGGGFGTRSDSMSSFSAYSQWIVIVFMIAGGTSFALHFRALRKPSNYLRNAEFRLYIGLVLGFSAIIVLGTWGDAIQKTVRDAVFTVSSIMTTTGFATADFGAWSASMQLIVLGLMFIGAMAGSTSGSVKVSRIDTMWSTLKAHITQPLHPMRVIVVRSGGVPVSDEVATSVRVFITMYLFLFMTGTALLAVITWIVGPQLDLVSSASAVAATLGNVGPGLGAVGPTHNFAAIPDLGKWLLSGLMIVGRLEILPILLLFMREFWRR